MNDWRARFLFSPEQGADMKMIMIRNLPHIVVKHPLWEFSGILLFGHEIEGIFHKRNLFRAHINAVLTKDGDGHLAGVTVENGETQRRVKLGIPLRIMGHLTQIAHPTRWHGSRRGGLRVERPDVAGLLLRAHKIQDLLHIRQVYCTDIIQRSFYPHRQRDSNFSANESKSEWIVKEHERRCFPLRDAS